MASKSRSSRVGDHRSVSPLRYRLRAGRVIAERVAVEIPESDIRRQLDARSIPASLRNGNWRLSSRRSRDSSGISTRGTWRFSTTFPEIRQLRWPSCRYRPWPGSATMFIGYSIRPTRQNHRLLRWHRRQSRRMYGAHSPARPRRRLTPAPAFDAIHSCSSGGVRPGRGPGVSQSAELLVVDQLGDRRVLSAHRAFGITRQPVDANLHAQACRSAACVRSAARPTPRMSLMASSACTQPTRPGSTPSTPASAQLGAAPGGGGSGYRQR